MTKAGRSCVFCEIAARRAPAHVIDEDNLSLCLLDIQPFTEGHCLVISKRHVPWWHDLSEPEIVSLFRMAKRVADRLGTVYKPEFVCMYARGRRVPHTHVFLVPTSKGDILDGFFNRTGAISGIARGTGCVEESASPGQCGQEDPRRFALAKRHKRRTERRPRLLLATLRS